MVWLERIRKNHWLETARDQHGKHVDAIGVALNEAQRAYGVEVLRNQLGEEDDRFVATGLMLADRRESLLLDPLAGDQVLEKASPAEAEIIAGLTERSKQESTESWSLLEIENGIGWVTGATSEEFIPQMMNLQLLDGISFTKGCYLGQEIIARMEYRGQLKRSMVRGSVTTNERPSVGDELVGDDGKRVGTVVSVTVASAGFDLLAVIQKNEDLPRCLLASGDEVNLLPLPYLAEIA